MATQSTPTAFGIPFPSPSISENVFVNETADPILTEVQVALGACRVGVESAREGASAIHADDTQPNSARHLQARVARVRVHTPWLEGRRPGDGFGGVHGRLTRQENFLPRQSPARRLAGEIRARLAAMAPGDRMKTILADIAAGSDQVAGSVLSAPAFLSGMEPPELENIRGRWRAARMADDCARLEELKKAAVHLERGGRLALAFQSKCSDPQILAAAKASQARAAAAVANAQKSAGLH